MSDMMRMIHPFHGGGADRRKVKKMNGHCTLEKYWTIFDGVFSVEI